MSPNSLKQMVACGFIDEIIIASYPEYFTLMFLTSSGIQKQHQQYLSYDDRKCQIKRFHSAKSLYAKIDEILNWPVNPETFNTLTHNSVGICFPSTSSLG